MSKRKLSSLVEEEMRNRFGARGRILHPELREALIVIEGEIHGTECGYTEEFHRKLIKKLVSGRAPHEPAQTASMLDLPLAADGTRRKFPWWWIVIIPLCADVGVRYWPLLGLG